MERKRWIDVLRGFCMIAILVYHTEYYYKELESEVTPYNIYVTNAITLFFFISGYLFFKDNGFSIRHKLLSIVRSLLIPYFIFTFVITVSKTIVYGEDVNLLFIITKIILGRASWFIAALIVAETLFAIVLYISKEKHLWLSVFSILFFLVYTVVPYNQYNCWQWQDAFLAIPFLYLGYLYHQYENTVITYHKPLYSFFLLLILIFIKIYEFHANYPMNNISITNYPLFAADTLLCITIIIGIIRYIPPISIIEWTGKHCIVYYFLSGGCPVMVSLALHKLGYSYNHSIFRFLLAFILVYIFCTFLTWLIYKYVPFLTGRTKI